MPIKFGGGEPYVADPSPHQVYAVTTPLILWAPMICSTLCSMASLVPCGLLGSFLPSNPNSILLGCLLPQGGVAIVVSTLLLMSMGINRFVCVGWTGKGTK